MKLERRVPLAWLIGGAVLACAWCSLLSGLGGWLMGQDLAHREAQATMATALAGRLDLPPLGVPVIRLDRNGPAIQAGVKRGDVIVAIDGRQIEGARDLHDQMAGLRPGDTVRLTVQNEQGQEVIGVRAAPFPGDGGRPYLGIYYTARADDPGDL